MRTCINQNQLSYTPGLNPSFVNLFLPLMEYKKNKTSCPNGSLGKKKLLKKELVVLELVENS